MNEKTRDRFADALSLLSRPWAAAVFAALVWAAFRGCFVFYPPLPHSDVWDYVQMARNVAEGEGFVSNFTYPVALQYDTEPPYPTLWRVPLHSSLIASVYYLTGTPSLSVPGVLTGAFFALAAALTALLGVRLLGRPLAGSAVLMVTLLPHLLSSALWGLTEIVYACFLLMAILALLRRSGTADLLAGVCLGLSWLTRSNTVFLLPGILALAALSGETWKSRGLRAARILGAIVLVCSPWWLRNFLAVGSPFVNVSSSLPSMFTETWPSWTLMRTVFLPGSEPSHAPAVEILGRGVGNLWTFWVSQRCLSSNPLAMALYYVGIFAAFRERNVNPRVWEFAAFVGISETTLSLALCFITPEIRIYSTLLPVVYVVALLPLRGAFQDKSRFKNLALIAVLAIAVAYSARFMIHSPRESWSTLTPEEIAEVRVRIPSEGVILSDTPDYLAWSLDRYSIALPTLVSLPRLSQLETAVTAVHLSPVPETLMFDEGNEEQGWIGLREGRLTPSPIGPLLHETESGHRFYEIQLGDGG